MIDDFSVPSESMKSRILQIEAIANNLANVNTPGYKDTRIEFQDFLNQSVRPAGTESLGENQEPTEIQVGCGTRPVATSKMYSQGDMVETGNPLDIAIQGDGFFQIQIPNGTMSYSRDSAFKLSSDGRIVNSDGFTVQPEITVPADASSLIVSRDGQVFAMITGIADPQDIGQVELARFINPAGLKNIGHNIYEQTAASGKPIIGDPGTENFGLIKQAHLEMSNVDVVDEMVNMIVVQRAYEINSKVIKAADDMMGLVNQIKSRQQP